MARYIVGQRFISETEPDLGLGIVEKVTERTIQLRFCTSNVTRQYVVVSAPIKRIHFKIGDEIFTNDKNKFIVKDLRIKNDIYFYSDGKQEYSESDISDLVSFNSPESRLYSANLDNNELFDLRYDSLQLRGRAKNLVSRGLLGGRINIIPHQIYIANEISRRHLPRVLLADEVGLGKTIEACLIVHRLMLYGIINRVLIIVPETLMNQWRAELFYRFNLSFMIMDKNFFKYKKKKNEKTNQFLETSNCITEMNILEEDEKIRNDLFNADWDMIIVDEVHHYSYNSASYNILEKLSHKIKRMILLSAIPEQLGLKNHFGRLKLLDPIRFDDYERFTKKYDHYKEIADLVNKIKTSDNIDKGLLNKLKDKYLITNENDKNEIIKKILDGYGPGRVMFRNSRSNVKGFPKRIANMVPLANTDNGYSKYLADEFFSDIGVKENIIYHDLNNDPRVDWLIDFCEKDPKKKILVFCTTKQKVIAINNVIKKKTSIKTALFHEDLSREKRESNVLWFVSSLGGQVLICSDIGSEGRNFQATNNLMMFDLPIDPELLEQRIGRLDRLGQRKDVIINVPYIKNSEYEILARWYNEGLNAFEKILEGGNIIIDKFKEKLIKTTEDLNNKSSLGSLIKETNKFNLKIKNELENGRDKLLELNSFSESNANEIAKHIHKTDDDEKIEHYMHSIFSFSGIHDKLIDDRTYHLTPGNLKTDAFPIYKKEGVSITYDRKKALEKESLAFITIDHPYVERAIDLIVGSETGNCSFGMLYNEKNEDILLEIIYVIESIAPKDIHIERFLSQDIIHVVINSKLEDFSDRYLINFLRKNIKNNNNMGKNILNNEKLKKELLPDMFKKNKEIAENMSRSVIKKAINDMEYISNSEIERLHFLQKINSAVRNDEINKAKNEKEQLHNYIKNARLRQDALRIILLQPVNEKKE